MTIVVTVLVLSVEYCLRIFGRWLSRTWLSDSHHGMEANGILCLGDPLSHNLALKKFVDQGWQLVYHSLFAFWEYLLLRKYNWFEGERLFFSVSEEEIAPDSIKFLFITQIVLLSNHPSPPGSLAVPGVPPRVRQPAQEGLLRAVHPPHRYSQSVLYSFPWPFHAQTSPTIATTTSAFSFSSSSLPSTPHSQLHDFSDILIDTLKLLNLCKISGSEDYFILETEYALTCAVWSYERLYLLPYLFLHKGLVVCWKLYSNVPRIEMLKAEWIFLLQIACLVVLYILHWYWFILLLRLGVRAFVT